MLSMSQLHGFNAGAESPQPELVFPYVPPNIYECGQIVIDIAGSTGKHLIIWVPAIDQAPTIEGGVDLTIANVSGFTPEKVNELGEIIHVGIRLSIYDIEDWNTGVYLKVNDINFGLFSTKSVTASQGCSEIPPLGSFVEPIDYHTGYANISYDTGWFDETENPGSLTSFVSSLSTETVVLKISSPFTDSIEFFGGIPVGNPSVPTIYTPV